MSLVVVPVLLVLPFVFLILYIVVNYIVNGKKSVCVVVLGDLGRSPRMLYHSLSFSKEGFHVDMVGYAGSKLPDTIRRNKDIRKYMLPEPPGCLKYLPQMMVYMIKVLWQSLTLGITMLLSPKAGYIMLQKYTIGDPNIYQEEDGWDIMYQSYVCVCHKPGHGFPKSYYVNPPSIPTMAVCWIVCLLRGSKLVIDWHNYGYTILGLTLGEQHFLVQFSKWYENYFGRFSAVNFCVTNAMKDDLRNLRICANTLYDRPAEDFKKTLIEDKHKILLKLSKDYDTFVPDKRTDTYIEETILTVKLADGKIIARPDRPAFLISSTSWTEDEDFGVLLQTLHEYEKEANTDKDKLPDVVCVITGKGPQKEFYKNKIEKEEWKHVKFCLPWLESEDYPVLLGCADLGICLHTSSSGLDLPMKVVDMFGCGLPVCAINFKCLAELVQHEHNGLIFRDGKQLFEQLKYLLKGFPLEQKKLLEMREKLEIFQTVRWHESWKKTVLPLLLTDKEKWH